MSEQRLRRSAQSSRTGTAGAASSETAAFIRINEFGYRFAVERRRDPVRDARSAAGIWGGGAPAICRKVADLAGARPDIERRDQ